MSRAPRAARPAARALAVLVIIGACLSLTGCGGSAPERKRQFGIRLLPSTLVPGSTALGRHHPNIVFILTDDLSLDLLRFMPHVRAMEKQGLTFNNYFVTDSLCCPSRASIFTGNLPHDTHVFTNTIPDGGFRVFQARGEEEHTFALTLERAGYLTGMMGKFLNGYLERAGRFAFGAAADVGPRYVAPGWNEWDVAGQGYPEYDYRMNEAGAVYHFGHQPRDYLTNVLSRKGADFIHAAAQRRQDFFLELATFAPHSPYTPAPRDVHDFPGLTAPRPPNFDVLPSHPPRWLAAHRRLSRREIHAINRAFRRRAESVQAVDRMIGQIERALRRNGLASKTYIIFSSDNGLHTGEYRLTPGKLTAYDTDIHVPLVVTGPGVPKGASTNAMAENIDLAETFSAIGGMRMPADGHSLLALWHGGHPTGWRNAVLIEHRKPLAKALDPDFQQPASGEPTSYEAMRTQDYLYVQYTDGEHEFYDLRSDPFELNNIFHTLNVRQRRQLHFELRAMQHCHTGPACWSAMHVAPLPGSW